MKSLISILFCMLCVISIAAQEKEAIELNSFSEVNIIGKIDAELIQSETEKLEISYNGLEKDDLMITTEGGVLKIKIFSSSLTYQDVRVNAKIYFNDVTKINSNSSAIIVSKHTFIQDELSLDAGSGGEMYLKLDAEKIEVKVTEGSVIQLEGQVNEQNVNVASGGTLSAYDLESKYAEIKATAGGKAKVKVTDFLKANASLGGYVAYTGEPVKKKIKDSLGGEVVRGSN